MRHLGETLNIIEIRLDRTWGVNFVPSQEFLKKIVKDAPEKAERIIIRPMFNNPADSFSGYEVEYHFPQQRKIEHYSFPSPP